MGQVKSAARILDLLEYFGSVREPKFLKDIVLALGFPKSSTLMLLRTLEERGYLERGYDERYVLNPLFLGSDHGWVGGLFMALVRVAKPVMHRLVDDLQETTVLGALTPEMDVRVIFSLSSPLMIRFDVSNTPILPTYCTALGQVMLAYSDDAEIERYIERCTFKPLTENTITDPEIFRKRLRMIRGRGYSTHIEERFPAASGAAVPLFDSNGKVHAALNMATVTTRFRKKRKQIIEALMIAGDEIMDAANGSNWVRKSIVCLGDGPGGK